MPDKRYLYLLPWVLGLLWIVVICVAAWPILPTDLIFWLVYYMLPMFIVGVGTGWAIVWLVEHRRWRIAPMLTGYLVFAPPAIRLGAWGAVKIIATFSPDLSFVIAQLLYLVLFTIITSCLLLLAIIVGHRMGKLVSRFISPYLVPAGRWLLAHMPSRAQRYRVAVLMTVFIGLIVLFWHRLELRWELLRAETPSASMWHEREQTTFGDALQQGRYDILVVPFQTDGLSVDRVARSLMTRQLAREIAQRSSLKVPDPTWVARALGASARTIPDDAVRVLADRIGARLIVSGFVARDTKDGNLTVTIAVRERTSIGEWAEEKRQKWGSLGFNDTHPPSVAFRNVVPAVTSSLPVGELSAPRSLAVTDTLQPLSLEGPALASLADAPAIDRALALQVLAILHDPGSLVGEQLWERSLITLDQVASDTPYRDVLLARAYFHLHRRPYAVSLLRESADTAASHALRGVLLGNLPIVEEHVEKIEHDAMRLIALLEAEDLRIAYHKNYGYEQRAEKIAAQYPKIAWLMRLRLNQAEWFNTEMHAYVNAALNGAGIQGIATSLADYGDQAVFFLQWLYFIHSWDESALQIAKAVERSHTETWRSRAADWTGAPAFDRSAEWDYFDLLYEINRTATIKVISGRLYKQALPQVAHAQIDMLEPVFRDHPSLIYAKSYALWYLAAQNESRRVALQLRSQRLGLDVYRWEGGETRLSRNAEWFAARGGSYEKYADEPMRSYRESIPVGELISHDTNLSPSKSEGRVAHLTRRLAYTQTDVSILQELDQNLRKLGRHADAEKLITKNQERFVGSPDYTKFLGAKLRKNLDRDGLIRLLRDSIKRDPNEWGNYNELGRHHARNREFAPADEIFGAYPPFKDGSGNRVYIANRARNVASLFHRLGEVERSIPWYRLSISQNTGAGSEMNSERILAVLGGNYAEAAKHARDEMTRYNNANAATEYLSYLFVLGDAEEAWRQFIELEPRLGHPELWRAAFVGQRAAGTDNNAVVQWVLDAKKFDHRNNYLSRALRERHAFTILAIDRALTAESVQLMRDVTAHYNRSHFYIDLAEGYFALQRGRFNEAVNKLRGLSRDLTGISADKGEAENFVLPYLVLAQIKAGREPDAQQILDNYALNASEDFDYWIGRALLDGYAGRTHAAYEKMFYALEKLPRVGTRAFFPVYVLIEACEALLADRPDPRYRELLLRFARIEQTMRPSAWAYAVEAKYANSASERKKALAAALRLDLHSRRIEHYPEQIKQQARDWLAHADPFGAKKALGRN